jgi:hypothetical protein
MAHQKLSFIAGTVGLLLVSPALQARDLAPNAVDSTDFFSVAPCRAIDTRLPDGPLGGPALVAGADRTFPLSGACGIPSGASAVSVNIAVIGATAAGNLRLHPGGTPVPLVATVTYSAGETRSNNAVAALSATGELGAYVGGPAGSVHFVLDVNGYFLPSCDPDGTYAKSGAPITYTCCLGFVNVNISTFAFTNNGAAIDANPSGPVLTSATPTTCPSGAFNNTFFSPGGCTITHNLLGSFSDANAWSGTYSLQFTGYDCSCFGGSLGTPCVNQSFPVAATR